MDKQQLDSKNPHDTFRARATLMQSGKSPLQLAEENEIKICGWVLRNGFTIELVTSILFGNSKSDYCSRLAKRGLLKSTPIPPGYPVSRYYPANNYYTLTDAGLALALYHDPLITNYPEIDPHKVRAATYFHSVLFQVETAFMLCNKTISDYKTERMLPHGKLQVKIPDGSWLHHSGEWVHVEIENRDFKCANKLLLFVSGILNSLDNGGYKYAMVMTHTQDIQAHYKSAFKAGEKYFTQWVKDPKGNWIPKPYSETLIDEVTSRRVMFKTYTSPAIIRKEQRAKNNSKLDLFIVANDLELI
jgi:hypothetical protein